MSPARGRRPTCVLPWDAHATVVLARDDAEVASWPLARSGRPDLAVVEGLARLQVEARRLGYSIQVRNASAELMALLDLCGLRGVLTGDDRRPPPAG